MPCTLSKYTDYLLSTPKYATATRMSSAFGLELSHDKISRWLKMEYLDSRSIWKSAKSLIRFLVDLYVMNNSI